MYWNDPNLNPRFKTINKTAREDMLRYLVLYKGMSLFLRKQNLKYLGLRCHDVHDICNFKCFTKKHKNDRANIAKY